MPKVSVIVPNYNHAPYLQQRIGSILNQTYQDFELILLDDYSTDGSREILLSYKDHPKVSHLIFNEQNSDSTFKQWNKGIELAQGEYIWIAESDDFADNQFIETIIEEFEKRPNVGLIYTASKLINSNNEITYENQQQKLVGNVECKGIEFISQKLVVNNAIWNASMMMFRKSIYPDIKKQQLYEWMHYCGDWFFYVLLSEQMDVLEIKKALNYFRIHQKNVSSGAEKSGLTFVEGLDVYTYVKKKINYGLQLKSSFKWAKNYNKYKRKYKFSRELRMQIVRKMLKEHFDIYFFNALIAIKY